MSHLLGIDLGTSSVKALLVQANGQVVGQGNAEYPIHTPSPGTAEQDPAEWWQATVAAARQAQADTNDTVTVTAIGVSGQMHGTVLLNDQCQVLAPAIIWPDQRTERQVQEITTMIGAERLIELTGSPVVTGFQAASVRWVQQEQPTLWQQVHKILLPKDYLRWRLTGRFDSDPSDGSGTLLLDVHRRDWSLELLEALEIEPEKLPPVQPSIAVEGELRSDAAEALGLPPGIPVVTGAADTPSSLLGAGVIDPESLLLTLSTGGQLVLPAYKVEVDKAGRIHTFCSALEPTTKQAGWYKMGGTLAAGLALRWLRDKVLDLHDPDAYTRMTAWAQDVPPGANGLIFVPHLIGERTPYMDPHARGMFLGLTLQHGQPELVRAVMEGVVLACYEGYSVLAESGATPQSIVLGGGGARSELWQQIVADVFGLPVQALRVAEQSASGAAILAGAGVGLLEPCATAHAWASYGSLVEPNPENHATYQELLALFRSAYQKHRDDFTIVGLE